MKPFATATSWIVMLAACVALAVLIAFSLQKLVPQQTSKGSSLSAQNRVAPGQTETEVSSDTADQSVVGNQSGADAESENQLKRAAGDPQDGSVNESAADPANDVATAAGADTNAGSESTETEQAESQADSLNSTPDQQPSETVTLAQPSGSVLVDSVSEAEVAIQDEVADAGQSTDEQLAGQPSSNDVASNVAETAASSVRTDGGKSSVSDAAQPTEQAEQSVDESTEGSNELQSEEASETVTLERIPRSGSGNADGPVDVTSEGVVNEEPLSLGLNANAGKVIVSGKLPRSRFASVLLQVLRSATDKPLDARKLELIAGDTRDTPWVFDIAKAMGRVDLEFTTLDLQSDGQSITVVGDVSTIMEKQELLGIFESEDTSLDLHPDSQVLVVPVQQAQLTIGYNEGEYEISGVLANAQRELFERSVATRTTGDVDIRWRRKVRQMEIVDSLSVILDIMQKSLQSGELRAGLDSMELEGIVSDDPVANLTVEEQEAERRNVVAVFSSVLPETESVRIDIRLNSGELADSTSAAIPSAAIQSESQTETAEQAEKDETTENPQNEAAQTETTENQAAQNQAIESESSQESSTQSDEVAEPATETARRDDSVVEGNADNTNNTNDGTNRVTELLAADAGIDTGLQSELNSTTKELQARFEQFEFAPGQSELNDENREILGQLFEVLFLFPSLKANMGVDVTDQNRSVENLSLSRQRADGIRDYVTGLGVESYRLTVAGYGDSRKATTQSTAESGVTLDFSSIP